MGRAKDIIIKPISSKDANKIIRDLHYSGKVVNNSQLHLGVFLDGKCGGALQFGPSLDKRKMLGLVKGTLWNEFLELNRMALADWLPKYGESRAISQSMRFIKKNYPHVKWVVSFADGSQCGDGTIYRASGFLLTGIKKNNQTYIFPDGEVVTRMTLTLVGGAKRSQMIKKWGVDIGSESSILPFQRIGAKPISGYQLRYIYFLHKEEIENLTVPTIPFDKIKEVGASMYRGKKTCPISVTGNTSDSQSEDGGSNPTVGLNSKITNG